MVTSRADGGSRHHLDPGAGLSLPVDRHGQQVASWTFERTEGKRKDPLVLLQRQEVIGDDDPGALVRVGHDELVEQSVVVDDTCPKRAPNQLPRLLAVGIVHKSELSQLHEGCPAGEILPSRGHVTSDSKAFFLQPALLPLPDRRVVGQRTHDTYLFVPFAWLRGSSAGFT